MISNETFTIGAIVLGLSSLIGLFFGAMRIGDRLWGKGDQSALEEVRKQNVQCSYDHKAMVETLKRLVEAEQKRDDAIAAMASTVRDFAAITKAEGEMARMRHEIVMKSLETVNAKLDSWAKA